MTESLMRPMFSRLGRLTMNNKSFGVTTNLDIRDQNIDKSRFKGSKVLMHCKPNKNRHGMFYKK